MQNYFDDDKLIHKKRNRPLQPNEDEQQNYQERKKEIFVINYGANELYDKVQKRRTFGSASKLFQLDKNENREKRENRKENIRRKKHREVKQNS
jgi:hypothetical protein